MKQYIKHIVRHIAATFCIMLIASCSSNNNFNFETADEALNACKSELNDLNGIEKADTKKLTLIANRWIALQDSTIKAMAKTDTINVNHPMFHYFFTISDSIRTRIVEIAYQQDRSIEDVVYLKLNTTYGKEEVTASQDYKNAVKFFENLDKSTLYPNAQKAVEAYADLFKKTGTVKKENDLLEFMKNEDICYRSILRFQRNITQEQMENIVEASEEFFNNLQYAAEQKDNNVNRRLLTYFNVRINRRIVMSLETCIADIENGANLSEEDRNNYRWSILQPYLSIDKFMAAYLTPEQINTLMKYGKKLPDYLTYLDGNQKKIGKKEKKTLDDLLSNSLLSMYLKQSL